MNLLLKSCFIFLMSLAALIPLYKLPLFIELIHPDSFQMESSVWCLKGFNNSKLCKFKNVCYQSEKRSFLFFLSEGSILKGVKEYKDLQRIQLSSVAMHNQFYANITVLDFPSDLFGMKEKLKVVKKGFAMARLKPDNLMHVIHDDLLPLFLTLEYICGETWPHCSSLHHLLLIDHHRSGPYFDLYKLFANDVLLPIREAGSAGQDRLICFKEIFTGLVQDGIFYDYGFRSVQGPVRNPYLSYGDILRFCEFVRKGLGIMEKLDDEIINVAVIERKKSRKILNMNKLVDEVKNSVGILFPHRPINVSILDLQMNHIKEIIEILTQIDILIGMHGAAMILGVFSKKNLTVFELFPFGIQPEIVSFLKPLSELEDTRLHHITWENTSKNHSLPHPDAHPLLGGINHLSESLQREIESARRVPAVRCCNDPMYLYHMYQDTWVPDDFATFFQDSLMKSRSTGSKAKPVLNQWFYPDVPLNVTCNFYSQRRALRINWMPPFNVNDTTALVYSLYIKDDKNTFAEDFITDLLTILLEVPRDMGLCPKFSLWIFAKLLGNGSSSKDSHFTCSCRR